MRLKKHMSLTHTIFSCTKLIDCRKEIKYKRVANCFQYTIYNIPYTHERGINCSDLGWYHSSIMRNKRRANASSSRYLSMNLAYSKTYSIFCYIYILKCLYCCCLFVCVCLIIRFLYVCPEENVLVLMIYYLSSNTILMMMCARWW